MGLQKQWVRHICLGALECHSLIQYQYQQVVFNPEKTALNDCNREGLPRSGDSLMISCRWSSRTSPCASASVRLVEALLLEPVLSMPLVDAFGPGPRIASTNYVRFPGQARFCPGSAPSALTPRHPRAVSSPPCKICIERALCPGQRCARGRLLALANSLWPDIDELLIPSIESP